MPEWRCRTTRHGPHRSSSAPWVDSTRVRDGKPLSVRVRARARVRIRARDRIKIRARVRYRIGIRIWVNSGTGLVFGN